MIVRMGLLQKRHDLSDDAFHAHWLQQHAELAKAIPGLRRYHQNHIVDRAQRGISYARGGLDFDGFSELWFDDIGAMKAAFAASDAIVRLAEDETRFISDLKLITAVQHIVIEPVANRPLIKRMSTLRRRPDISPDTFTNEWFDLHAQLVKRLPGVRGYTQNLVVERLHGRSRPATSDEVPVDGMVELWFDDADSLAAAFATDAAATLMAHAKEFIAEISTFLVETHTIV